MSGQQPNPSEAAISVTEISGPSTTSIPAEDASNKPASPAPIPKARDHDERANGKRARVSGAKGWNAYGDSVKKSRKDQDSAGTRERKTDATGEGSTTRLPKRKVALLIGYCGTGYSGMQIQKDHQKTIEGDVFTALVKAGAISLDNSDDPKKVDIQRSARTDAGVHAAGNVISLKLIMEPPLPEGFSDLKSYVNSLLPPQIRMWGLVRTVNSFVARGKYEYLLPSYCLLPPRSSDALSKLLDRTSPGWRDSLGEAGKFADAGIEDDETAGIEAGISGDKGKFVETDGEKTTTTADSEGADGGDTVKSSRQEFERRRGWRVDDITLERFRALVAKFQGTHNFHNYTIGKPFNDKTVKRYMISLEVRPPTVVGDIEWVSVAIHGQSFMLHQIRKMMSLAMLACRTGTPESLIPETFGPKRIHIPKAPPLGLLLEAPQFGPYNERITEKSANTADARDPVSFEPYVDEIYEFKRKWIYETLRKDEGEFNIFHKWIRQMDCTTDAEGVLGWLNTKGIIPAGAEVKKMTRRFDKGGTQNAKTEGDGVPQSGSVEGVEKVESKVEGYESDDEEIDEVALKRGELEG